MRGAWEGEGRGRGVPECQGCRPQPRHEGTRGRSPTASTTGLDEVSLSEKLGEKKWSPPCALVDQAAHKARLAEHDPQVNECGGVSLLVKHQAVLRVWGERVRGGGIGGEGGDGRCPKAVVLHSSSSNARHLACTRGGRGNRWGGSLRTRGN